MCVRAMRFTPKADARKNNESAPNREESVVGKDSFPRGVDMADMPGHGRVSDHVRLQSSETSPLAKWRTWWTWYPHINAGAHTHRHPRRRDLASMFQR
jgi:hypothetical protein